MAEFHVDASQVIRASPERVWAAYTDWESHPKWDKSLLSLRVLKREGNVDWVEVEQRGVGRINGTHRCFPMSRVEAEMKAKHFIFKAALTLERIPEGTMFRVVGDVNASGILMTLLGPLVRRRVESGTKVWNQALAGYVESLT